MSVTSSTDICNLALDLLSVGNVQNVEEPTTPTEEILNRWYDQSRRKLLREHPWKFATKRIILAADSEKPAFGYSSQFTLPSDFVRLMSLSTDLSSDYETFMDTEYYRVENQKILMSDYFEDATTARLIYVADIKNVSNFDPMFVDLLSYEIALSVAYKLSESNTNIKRLDSLQKRRSSIARAITGQESPPKRIQRSRALSARRTAGSTTRADRTIF